LIDKVEQRPFSSALRTTSQFIHFDRSSGNWDQKAHDRPTFSLVWKTQLDRLLNATDSSLKELFSRGGKVLMYHGWNDQLISLLNSVAPR
jgi:Tannase and feruloyl esterase